MKLETVNSDGIYFRSYTGRERLIRTWLIRSSTEFEVSVAGMFYIENEVCVSSAIVKGFYRQFN